MRVPHFLLFTLGLSAALALFGCSRESSVKENVNLKNNHSRVFAFNQPIENAEAFADSIANTPSEADSIADTLTVTVNDTVYMIGLLPYHVDKIYRFLWVFTKKDGKDTSIVGQNATPQSWAYAKPGLYEPKFIAFDGNNATDTAGTATRKAWIRVIDTKPTLVVPKDTLWTRHDGDITFPILVSDSFGTIKSIQIDLDASGKSSPKTAKYEKFDDNDSLYLTVKNDSLGNQKVYVIVTDDDNNETKDSVNLHFNRVPKLKVIYPQDGALHNVKDRFYFYYEGTDADNPQNLKYFIYAQMSKNGQPPQKAFTEDDLIASEFTSGIFEPIDKNGNNVITLIKDPSKELKGRIYWDMYVTDGYDITRLARITTGKNSSRPWNFYIGDLSSPQGTFTGVAKYEGRDDHSGIRVEFNNGNKTFDVVTDEKGNYSVKVDVGLYTGTAFPATDAAKDYISATIKDMYMESGNTVKNEDLILKDTLPPSLRKVSNIDLVENRESLKNINIYAIDRGSHLDSVTATIDGNALTLACTKTDANAVFNCNADLSKLTDGEHKLVAKAKDKAGNRASIEQTIKVNATSINLSANGGQNTRIGKDEKVDFVAKVIGAYPAAKSVTWTWDLGAGAKTQTTKVLDDGTTSFTFNYSDIAAIKPDSDYVMKATYKENGANVSAEVSFGLLGDNPSAIFSEPGLNTKVSLNDPIHFMVTAYKGKESNSLTLTWNCGSNLSSGYTCPSKTSDLEHRQTSETTLAFNKVGKHTVSVNIKDEHGNENKSITVEVESDVPTISASTDSKTNEYKINASVPVNVSASDKYGTINKFKWGCSNGSILDYTEVVLDKPAKTVTDYPITVTLPGSETSNYKCAFYAIDDDGETSNAATVTFTTLIDKPTVQLATKKDTVKINSTQTLKAIATDKLGSIVEYNYACSEKLSDLDNPNWSPMNGNQVSVRMPSTATSAYYCAVQVFDDDHNEARDMATYTILLGLPTVTAIANYKTVTIKDVVELNAHAQDSLGEIVKYEWGCAPASSENIGFTYSSPTSPRVQMTMPAISQKGYKCLVRVTDDDGNTAKDSVKIDIEEGKPTIKVDKKEITVREGYKISLSASAEDNNLGLPSDPGGIVKKEWGCGTPEQIKWETVSTFDTSWTAPAPQADFKCTARATDNDGLSVTASINIVFSTDLPEIWVKQEVIYINVGDPFDLDAEVNKVWQGIDWFSWECKDTTGKSLEKKVIKYDYEANGEVFAVTKDSSYSEHGKNMLCTVTAQEHSTGKTFDATTTVRIMKQHPVGVITAADTVYLWSGYDPVSNDASATIDKEAIYFYTDEWNAKNSKMGDLGNADMQEYLWKFSNVGNIFYLGKPDGTLDTALAEFNTAFIRKTREGSITITLDYHDSTSTSATPAFKSRHYAELVSRKVYFRKAWRNQGTDTVITKSTMTTAPVLRVINDQPYLAFLESEKKVTIKKLDGTTWQNVASVTTDTKPSKIRFINNGNNLYLGILESNQTFTVYKYDGSSFATMGSALSSVLDAQIVVKTGEEPHAVILSNETKNINLYDYSSGWTKNKTFGNFKEKTTFREVDAIFNADGLLTVVGVNNEYTAYYGLYSTAYQKLNSGDNEDRFGAIEVNNITLHASGSDIYMGFLSRNVNTYGPYVFKGTFGNNKISWDNGASSLVKKPLYEGYIANSISLTTYGNTLYAAIDAMSQVHVFRYDGIWHFHGENMLPYFDAVFYADHSYYLRGASPSLAVNSKGNIYVSMLAREAAGGTSKNNGPLVMKYVADNWKVK